MEAAVDPYFKQVYDQFLAVKKSCGEPTGGLTYQKFAEKLIKNRDDLMSKTGCKEVRFTVYVKDGKAALKATPVKEDDRLPTTLRAGGDDALAQALRFGERLRGRGRPIRGIGIRRGWMR